jgi:putative ABC transport system permease protein
VNLAESFRVALRALRANKFRATLTMLGVIIGVASVILLTSIGTGVKNDFVNQIEGMGSNLVYVFPSENGGAGQPSPKKFKPADRDYLKERLSDAEAVVGLIQTPVSLKAGNHSLRSVAVATDDGQHVVFKTDIEKGRSFRPNESDTGARVVTIGSKVAEELFPGQDPIGKTLTMNGQRLTVIGLSKKQGGSVTGDKDNSIVVPLSTGMRMLGTNDLEMLVVKVGDAKDIDRTSMRVKHILRPRFGADLSAYSQKETVGVLDKLLGTLTVMLAGIAGISLFVGGIGIMNIMLVSVSERTREIGIRKAVGARTWDVLAQFVIEAVILSVTGGVIGILLGAGGALSLRVAIPTSIDPVSTLTAFLFAVGIGVFFGVYPAAKAAKLDPILALRHE